MISRFIGVTLMLTACSGSIDYGLSDPNSSPPYTPPTPTPLPPAGSPGQGGGGASGAPIQQPPSLEPDPDADGISNAIEGAPSLDTDADGVPDYRDVDSDNDGLADAFEDPNGNGVVDAGETDVRAEDTDLDGATDLIEVAAQTDPQDAADNPPANGDFVFVVPYDQPASPSSATLDFSTALRDVDIYVLLDRSDSMQAEVAAIRSNLQRVANRLTCPPLGTGATESCIPNLWWGAGSFGYVDDPTNYRHHLDLQPNPTLLSQAIPINPPETCCDEPTLLALWSTLTGKGTTGSTCSVSPSYPARSSCDKSFAGSLGVGYPCFRAHALPIVLLATDEAPIAGDNVYICPGKNAVIDAAIDIGARIIGVVGDLPETNTKRDLEQLARGSGAVNARDNDRPLVMQGLPSSAPSLIEDAIRTLADAVPLDVSARVRDQGGDAVNAVEAFIHHVETSQLGTAACADGLTVRDTNNDNKPDKYIDVPARTPVCWKVVPRRNQTVRPTTTPQLYQATIDVRGENITLLDQRQIFFLVPPLVEGLGAAPLL